MTYFDPHVDLDYLRKCLEVCQFTPYPWEGEDKNLAAFRSREDLIAWYCQPPGVPGQPYRDRRFYCRELAMMSRVIQPRVVVELGTSIGLGTCLLSWLNPKAKIVTVDINTETYMPYDKKVLVGHLARYQGIDCEYVTGNSWEYVKSGVDLCFIDADHSYEACKKDSDQAWLNRSSDHSWGIVWHDFTEEYFGVPRAVREFCADKGVVRLQRSDSDTVWVWGGVDHDEA